MCQLTYANFHDPFLNSLIAYLLAYQGSEEKHDDGCGFICPDNTIWKTEIAAHRLLNLGELIFEKATKDPLPFHIRQATYGIEVSKENSHPFIGTNYILMHNGTLLPRSGEEPKDKKKDSDSLKFLKALDKVKKDKPDATFDEIFNDAMNEFTGKFAFIIRDKQNNNDFIIRGKTAELWISFLEQGDASLGYVINTSKETLTVAAKLFRNITAITTGNTFIFTEPKLLDLETIYLAKDLDIKKFGSTKEHSQDVVIRHSNPMVPRTSPIPYSPISNKKSMKKLVDNFEGDIADLARISIKIFEFLRDHSFSLLDLQIMLKIMGGISILEVTMEDLKVFVEHMIPKISAEKQLRAKVKEVLKGGCFPSQLYAKYDLEYPWTVNPKITILKAMQEYSKEKGDSIPF